MLMPNPRQLSGLPLRIEGGPWEDLPSGGTGASPLCVEGAGRGVEIRRAVHVPEHCHTAAFQKPQNIQDRAGRYKSHRTSVSFLRGIQRPERVKPGAGHLCLGS